MRLVKHVWLLPYQTVVEASLKDGAINKVTCDSQRARRGCLLVSAVSETISAIQLIFAKVSGAREAGRFVAMYVAGYGIRKSAEFFKGGSWKDSAIIDETGEVVTVRMKDDESIVEMSCGLGAIVLPKNHCAPIFWPTEEVSEVSPGASLIVVTNAPSKEVEMQLRNRPR